MSKVGREYTIHLSLRCPTEEVLVVPGRLCIKLDTVRPSLAHSLTWTDSMSDPSLRLITPVKHGESEVERGSVVEFDKNLTAIYLTTETLSKERSENQISFSFISESGEEVGKATLLLTVILLCLDVDADRDGEVEQNSPNKNSWKSGPGGHGAVLLFNCDVDEVRTDKYTDQQDDIINGVADLEDMSPLILRTDGPEELPDGCQVELYVEHTITPYICIFDVTAGLQEGEINKFIIGPGCHVTTLYYPGSLGEVRFAIEARSFPSVEFDGFVRIHLTLFKNTVPIFDDAVLFRVSPWIMTPNTLPPKSVYVCQTKANVSFINGLRNVVNGIGNVDLQIVPQLEHRGDCWMQDEIELGYQQAPHKTMPVVLDSPRDRGLQAFPKTRLLGIDFGYVTVYSKQSEANSLDSFGNLEVTPPLSTEEGGMAPFGKILIGNALTNSTFGRRMMQEVLRFLQAQRMQPVVELYSDWLLVGHIDEFLSFVPAPNRKGFRLLLASPQACYKLLNDAKELGHGDALMFEGKPLPNYKDATRSINDLLEDEDLSKDNKEVQTCIDFNRDILKRELDLTELDIIDIPVLFTIESKNDKSHRGAGALFPDIVNMLVLGHDLCIPKPFGAIIDGECLLERFVREKLEQLNLTCHFMDEWTSYHIHNGEIHCGTNCLREPFATPWWDVKDHYNF